MRSVRCELVNDRQNLATCVRSSKFRARPYIKARYPPSNALGQHQIQDEYNP
jgi:hypothetical protein